MRRPKKLDPKTSWVITDSTRPITPTFYHEDLARAVLKELSKDIEGLELRKDAASADGTFLDAMKILSRENRWLDASARDKRYFQGLCEGWMTTAARQEVGDEWTNQPCNHEGGIPETILESLQ